MKIATTIESLMNLLDAIDGDENLEPDNDDEHSNGWPANGPSQYHVDHDDRELDEADDEQSLGWTTDINQDNALSVAPGSWIVEDGELDNCDDEEGDTGRRSGRSARYGLLLTSLIKFESLIEPGCGNVVGLFPSRRTARVNDSL